MENDGGLNMTSLNLSQERDAMAISELSISSALVIFWVTVFMGFIFSLVTTICLLLTKEVQKGNMYITLSTMTFSELIVYLTFIILLGLNTFPRIEEVPYLCLFLNTIVGIFKAYSLSLAVYLSAERIMALSCRKLYQMTRKRNSRLVTQLVLMVLDSAFFFNVNFHYGSKDTDAFCTTDTVYPGNTYEVMSILRASAIPKMVLILSLSITTNILIRRKMRQVVALAERNTRDFKELSLGSNPKPYGRLTVTTTTSVQGPSCSGHVEADTSLDSVRAINKGDDSGKTFQTQSERGEHPSSAGKGNLAMRYISEMTLGKKENEEVIMNTLVNPKKYINNATESVHNTIAKVDRLCGKRDTPFWMKQSFKTISLYLFSYIIVYLPSIVYMTVMIAFPHIKEDAVSRGVNFLTPCVHSIVASFLYIFKVREISQKFKCRFKTTNRQSEI